MSRREELSILLFLILLSYAMALTTTQNRDGQLVKSVIVDSEEVIPSPRLKKQNGAVNFWLWTKANPDASQELRVSNVHSTNFNPDLPTKVLIHGFRDDGMTRWVLSMKNEYLQQGAFNILSVNWRKWAFKAYPLALLYLSNVGEETAELLQGLLHEFPNQLNVSSFHIVGFSLGAHVAGNVGRFFHGQISRITGLDPAGVLMPLLPNKYKLSIDKAKLVDVIHAAGLWLTIHDPIGHIDFYPNGGEASQPGCEGKDSIGLICSHKRAWAFYVESINSPTGFEAWQCEGWTAFKESTCNVSEVAVNWMGEHVDETIRGSFYLATASRSPFALPDKDE